MMWGSANARAGAFKPTDVPADAKWVVHLNLDSAKTSKIALAVQQRLMEREEVKQGVTDIATLTGVNVPEDLNDVTIYGSKFDEEDNVVLITGKFDQRRILGLVSLSPAYSSTTRDGHEIVSWEDKGKTNFGAFVGEDRLVIARTLENVAGAVQVLDAKRPSIKDVPEFAGADSAGPSSAMVYVGGTGLENLPNAAAASPLLTQARSAMLTIGEKDGQAYLKGLVKAVDPTKAEQLARAGEGLKSIVMLSASRRDAEKVAQIAGELLQTLKIGRVDQTVTLDWTAPADAVIDLIDEGVPFGQRGPDGQGVRTRAKTTTDATTN